MGVAFAANLHRHACGRTLPHTCTGRAVLMSDGPFVDKVTAAATVASAWQTVL